MTEWLMLTSGTSGCSPKIVGHTLEGLTGAIVADGPSHGISPVWATFYDIRRYGGLQIFLRAIIGGGSMVLSEPGEAIADYVRAAAGTFCHTNLGNDVALAQTSNEWRSLGFFPTLCPSVGRDRRPGRARWFASRLSCRLDRSRLRFDRSWRRLCAVNDGVEGFSGGYDRGRPRRRRNEGRGWIAADIAHGAPRMHYVRPPGGTALTDSEGFVDTGDMVELRGDRYYFIGRRGGIINIGGLKVHPEEIEAVINRHAEVRMSRARSRRSPITGAIVVVDVILADGCDAGRADEIRNMILADCRARLAPHKVPAMIRFVDALDVTAAGKLARTDA